MTTPLTTPVARLVTLHPGEALVVTLALNGITFRIEGTSTTYLLPYGLAYQRAAALEADRRLAERTQPRRVRRGVLATRGVR